MTRKEIAEALENIQEALAAEDNAPCTHLKGGKACTQQYEDQFDNDGRPVFFFNDGCAVVLNFCPACRAYWHVAVARNAMFDLDRVAPVQP